MSSATEEMLSAMRREMRPLLESAMESVLTKARGVLQDAEQQRTQGRAEIAKERAEALVEVDEERTKGLAEIQWRQAELHREIEAMQTHQAKQEGRVVLNIGGYKFETSVQTLRRLPHTFFDAYFSGRYAQDVCDDGSIFVDRDGEHFGHVLEYMRNGVVSVADPSAVPSISLLQALKREFGFYCIELSGEEPAEPVQPELAFVMGGRLADDLRSDEEDSDDEAESRLSSMERFDSSMDGWKEVAAMGMARYGFGACALKGELYVIGGKDANRDAVEIVEKYSPLSDTWSAVTSLPEPRSHHTAVTVGSDLYVLGGKLDGMATSSTLKFDSTQGVWNEVTSMPARRSAFAACAVGSDIYVFGGSCGPANVQPSVFKYDTVANVWDTLAPMPHSYFNNSASVLDGLVYIVGGGGTGQEVLRFDPASGVWRALARTKMSHFEGKSFVMDSYLFAVGGDTAGNMLMERYDQVANTWEYADSLIEGRSLCGAVTIAPTGRQAEKMDLLDTLIAKATQ